jgi:hypothetical protein
MMVIWLTLYSFTVGMHAAVRGGGQDMPSSYRAALAWLEILINMWTLRSQSTRMLG